MSTYAIYTNKKIRIFVDSNEESNLQANLQENEQYIQTVISGDPSLFMVYSDEVVALPPMPEVGYEFNYDTLVWFNARTIEQQTSYVELKRNACLLDSDWIVIKAFDTGTSIPEDWKTYRQALRDITLQPDIFNIVWPIAPQG